MAPAPKVILTIFAYSWRFVHCSHPINKPCPLQKEFCPLMSNAKEILTNLAGIPFYPTPSKRSLQQKFKAILCSASNPIVSNTLTLINMAFFCPMSVISNCLQQQIFPVGSLGILVLMPSTKPDCFINYIVLHWLHCKHFKILQKLVISDPFFRIPNKFWLTLPLLKEFCPTPCTPKRIGTPYLLQRNSNPSLPIIKRIPPAIVYILRSYRN